jgi:hypothetical protein
VSTAQSLANVAAERIDDGAPDPGLRRALHDLAAAGERAAVYNRAGRLIAGTGQWILPADHRPAHMPVTASCGYRAGDRLVALAPVVPDSGLGSVGTVAVSRSTAQVDGGVAMLWTLIGAVAAAGMLLAAGVGIAIAGG